MMMPAHKHELTSLPASSSIFRFNLLVAVLYFVLAACLLLYFPEAKSSGLTVVALLICTLILFINDLYFVKVQLRPSTQMVAAGPFDLDRYLTKLTGLFGTFGLILLFYWAAPFYRESLRAVEFYGHFFYLVQKSGVWLILGSAAYFAYVDRRQKEPYDSYWHMGCLILGRWRSVKPIFLQEHARVWFIKAFFAPFMFGALIGYTQSVASFDLRETVSFQKIYDFLLDLFYGMDVMFGFLGYVLTLRVVDTHVQSTEPKFWGWISCLACYYPFYALYGLGRFEYSSGTTWQGWLAGQPFFYYVCGTAIILLSAVYGLATVSFGYRMSNLTYRGIITDGFYRFTKHPAYISKVASWWLISLPFFSLAGAGVAIQQTLALVVVSLIYYVRAKTEENHLSNYPEYVLYAKWIDEHGIFSPLKKVLPFLRYSEDEVARAKSIVWFKKAK